MGQFLNGIHVSGTTQLDFMPTHESEGIITLGRYDADTTRYHNIKSYVSSTLASNYLKFSLHNGTASTVVDVLTLKGDQNVTFGKSADSNRDAASIKHADNDFLYVKGGTAGISINDDGEDTRMILFNSGNVRFDAGTLDNAFVITADTGNATFAGNVSVNAAGQKAVLHVKNEGNNWEDGVLLEHDSGDTGWNIHPENNSDNALWFGYNSDTSVALTSQGATTALKLNSDLSAVFAGTVEAGGTISQTSGNILGRGYLNLQNGYGSANGIYLYGNPAMYREDANTLFFPLRNISIKNNGGGNTKFVRIWNTGTADGDDAVLSFKTESSRTYSIGTHRDSGAFLLTNADASVASGELLTIDNSGNATFTGHVSLADGKSGRFGDSNDLKLYHASGASYIENDTGDLNYIQNNGSGEMIFTQNNNDGNINFNCDDGSNGVTTYLSLDGGDTRINVYKNIVSTGNATFANGIFATSGSVGSQLYGLELTRSGSGTSSVDMWGSSNTLVLGHSSSVPVITINSTATTFAGTVICGNVGSDKKIQFNRTSGNTFSIEHDSSQIYFYNETTSTAALRISNASNATFAGIVDATNFKIGGAQGSDGQVLTSTGSGVAWEDSSASFSGGTVANVILLPDGSTSAPSIGNTGDTNTGMYWPADHQVGFTVNNSRKFYMSETQAFFQNLSSGVQIDSSSDAPLEVKSSDATTGIKFTDNNANAKLYYVGSGNYFYTDAHRLGIGDVAAPSVALHVVGTDNVSSRFIFTKDTSTDKILWGGADHDTFGAPFIGSSSAHSFTITQGGGAAITIGTDKKVGIGLTNPTSQLFVKQSTSAEWAGTFQNLTANAYGLSIDCSTAAAATYVLAAYSPSGTGMFLNGSGQLGVGTNSPTTKLSVTDGATMYADSNYLAQIKRNAANGNDDTSKASILLCNNSNGMQIAYGGTTDRLRFIDGGGVERFTMLNGGKIGIGTIAPPHQILTVTGSSGAADGNLTAGILSLTTGTGVIADTRLLFGIVDDDYAWIQAADYGVAYRDLILSPNGGNVGIGTVAPAALLEISGSGDAIRVESTNAGAGGAQIDLLHFTASPADEDTYAAINMGGYYTGTTSVYGSQIKSIWTDVSERHSRLEFTTCDTTVSTALTLAHDNSATFTGLVGIGGTNPGDRAVYVTGSAAILELESTTANNNASVWFKSNVSGTSADRWELGTNISQTSSFELYNRATSASAFYVNSSNNATFTGDVTITGHENTINIGAGGGVGTFTTSDTNDYPRITTPGASAQLGLFRSGSAVGGVYIGADSGGFDIRNDSFTTLFQVDMSGNVQLDGVIDSDGTGTNTFAGGAHIAGNVGIGNTGPGYALDVTGDIRTSAWLRINDSGEGIYWHGTGHHIYPWASNYIRIRSGASGSNYIQLTCNDETARGYVYCNNSNQVGLLDSTGNWAVRVTNAGNTDFLINNNLKFSIQDSAEGAVLHGQDATGSNYLKFKDNDGNDQGYFGFGAGGSDELYIVQQASANMNFYMVNGTAMYIDTSKNAYFTGGIGLSNTSDVFYTTESTDRFRIYDHSGYYLALGASGSTWTHFLTNAGANYFDRPVVVDGGNVASYNENIEIRRDRSSSNVLIMTGNASGYLQPNTWIQLNASNYGLYSSTNGAHFWPNNGSSTYATWGISGTRGGYGGILMNNVTNKPHVMYDASGNGGGYHEGSNQWAYYWHVSNACLGIATSSTSSSYAAYVGGSIYATADVVAYSDRRAKENIVTVDNALDKVSELRGVYYNKKDSDEKKREVGVIAQEVKEVLPEVVTYDKENDQYGVDYGKINGLLIEAIKDLKKEIEELKQCKKCTDCDCNN